MAAMRVLLELQVIDREIFLFDTFSGMTQPTSRDEDINGASARELMESAPGREALINAYASLQEVRTNIAAVGYPMERVHFVEGPVEVTIPAASPDAIALLRLDTDWYESTRHELIHLGKRVSHLGVLIVDDYGHWHGARQAVDEFFATFERPVLLNRIDYTGRIAILP